MRVGFYLRLCLLGVLLNPHMGVAGPRNFIRRCRDFLSNTRESLLDTVQNYLNRPRYIEDSSSLDYVDYMNEFYLVGALLKEIQIGYDKDDSAAAPAYRWNGMWSKFTGNVWDIQYSDHPKIHGVSKLVFQNPDPYIFKAFAKKAIHFKGDPAPVAYVMGWESVSISDVDWAVHVVFVSGGDFWIFGKIRGSKKIKLSDAF